MAPILTDGLAGDGVKRRDFITLLGGAAAGWPIAARAQQAAMPVIGLLSGQRPELSAPQVAAFYRGLGETGFVQGRDVAIELRWANNDYTQFPALSRPISRCAGSRSSQRSRMAARQLRWRPSVPQRPFQSYSPSATTPSKRGFAVSLNRPGGNATGATFFANELAVKRLGLLHELLPKATMIAVLANANFPGAADQLRDIQEAARTLRLDV